jgi:putative ABC transport system permease protein
MQTIDLGRLVIVLLPALLVVFIQWRWSQNGNTTLYAIARMAIQLILIGYALTYIFKSHSSWLILTILSVMLFASSWIALRPLQKQRRRLFWDALLATFVVNASLLFLITAGVLRTEPWFTPNIIIPLAGMVFAAGMNSISLFGERYFAELPKAKDESEARDAAYQATLIPTINSLFAVGLVSLPGMMTGQILSGVSPLIAVRYQIMIMLMLLASSGLTAALFYVLMKRHRLGH